MRRSFLSLLLLLPLAVVACGGSDSPTQPSTPPPQGPATLQLTDLTVGTGDGPAPNSQVTVHYTLWLYDPAGPDSKGTRLESSRDAGRTTYTFRLGTNAVIPGFEQAINTMRVGGNRRAIIPPSLAYGSQAQNGIPANSWIVFEIELLTVS